MENSKYTIPKNFPSPLVSILLLLKISMLEYSIIILSRPFKKMDIGLIIDRLSIIASILSRSILSRSINIILM